MKRLYKCEYSELEYKPVCVDGPLCVDVLIRIEEEAEAVCQAGNGAPYYQKSPYQKGDSKNVTRQAHL